MFTGKNDVEFVFFVSSAKCSMTTRLIWFKVLFTVSLVTFPWSCSESHSAGLTSGKDVGRD